MSAQSMARKLEQMAEQGIVPVSTSNLELNVPLVLDTTVTNKGNESNAAGTFDTLDTGSATASSGAATLNKQTGTITSEALTTAAAGDYTLTLTNSLISATSVILCSLDNGTNTTTPIYVRLVTPGSGSATIIVRNAGAGALNGTIKIRFAVFN